ncbi:MAG: AsmA-like C-terminal region-containing protein [Shinella sp.]|nr:AsmA-like C-terminal region-containing protein [Shinella sp.]
MILFFGGLVVVALFVALLAPLFVDWTNFREGFEREASRIMGRKVVVHGSVDARLLPFPSVTLNDVRVGDDGSRQPLVEIARFSMDAELAPFLSGEALIFDMRIEEPKARIKLFPDGTLDWARGRKSDIPARTVVLENVTVTGGEVEFVDEQTGRTRRLTGLDAQISARSLSGPWKIDGRGVLDGEAGSFQLASGQLDDQGVLPLRARVVPDKLFFSADLDGSLRIVDFRPQYGGTFALDEKRIAKADPQAADPIRIAGAFELSNERLRVPEYRLEAGANEDPYIVTGEATLDTGKAPEFLLTADGQQIDVSRIGNSGENGKTGRNPQVSARHRLQALLAIAADIPVPQVPGRASLRLPAVVIGDTTVREVQLDLRPDGSGWRVDRAEALLPGRTKLEANGRLSLRGARAFTGDLLVASNQPSGLASWLAGSVDPEIRKLKTAGFSAKVDLTDELQRFENLEIAVGPASLTGRLERQSLSNSAPNLSIELRGNSIELDSLRALGGLFVGDASLSDVLGHAIAVDIEAERFTAFGEEAKGVSAALAWKEGTLTVDRLDISSVAGANVEVNGTLGGTLSSPSAGLRMSLKAETMGPVAELLARHLPSHPLLQRFVRNAGYYDGADLTLAASLPGLESDPATATLAGTVNGGKVDLQLRSETVSDLLAGRNFSLDGTLANPVTTVLAGQIGLDPLPFDAEPDGLLTVQLSKGREGPGNLSVSFATDRTTVTASGTAELAAENFLAGNLKLSAASDDIKPYLLMNGVVLPQSGAGLPLRLAADLAVDAKQIRVSAIDGEADRNGFSGDLTLDRTNANLKGAGHLSFDTIDLAWLAEAVVGPVEDLSQGGLNAAPLGTPSWDAADFSVKLDAREFWPGIYGAVRDFTAGLQWNGADLALDDIKGQWLAGSLSGRLKITNAEENGLFEARLGLSGADLAQALWARADGPLVEGRGDVTLAIDASGKSIMAMAESASGSGEALLEGLKINGLNAAAFDAILASADRMEGDITIEEVKAIAEREVMKGETVLGAVRIPFAIASGGLRLQNVAAENMAASFTGDAELDLSQDRLSASVTMGLHAGENALSGAEPEVTFSWAGLARAPGTTLDAQALTNYLSQRRFEAERRRVETLQANVLEKQRLRREAALYRSRVEARAALAEAMRLQAEEEARRRAEAKERAHRQKAEEARRLREAEEAARRQSRGTSEGPPDGVERGGELPPVDGGQILNFDALPGVN